METQIREALARGYCYSENEKKVVDPNLIEAMTKELLKSFSPAKPNLYCCGFCGSPCNENGTPWDGEMPANYNPSDYSMVNGLCCLKEQNQMRVTHDMAIDAGDPNLEGTLI